jgi:hypothetical protein
MSEQPQPELPEQNQWSDDLAAMLPFAITIGLIEGEWMHVEWARAG